MRTHPLVALAVIAAAITTLTVFGKSAPAFVPAPVAVKKAHVAKPMAPSAVPGWLAASSAS